MLIVPIPVPSGNWSIGPSLLYLFSVIGILIYLAITAPREPKKGPTPEQLSEKRKQEAFYKALMDATQPTGRKD